MLSFIYICHHPFLWLNYSSLFPWLQQQTPRFPKSPALAAKVLMILCQSEMQPGFKDRTPGVCRWWVVILMISYKGWVGVVMCVNTPRWTTGGWWWASLLYCYHYHPQNPHFFYCLIINHHHYYSCHYYHLSSSSSSVMMLKMTPIFHESPQTLKILPMQGIVKLLQLTHTLILGPEWFGSQAIGENGWGFFGMGGPS